MPAWWAALSADAVWPIQSKMVWQSGDWVAAAVGAAFCPQFVGSQGASSPIANPQVNC